MERVRVFLLVFCCCCKEGRKRLTEEDVLRLLSSLSGCSLYIYSKRYYTARLERWWECAFRSDRITVHRSLLYNITSSIGCKVAAAECERERRRDIFAVLEMWDASVERCLGNEEEEKRRRRRRSTTHSTISFHPVCVCGMMHSATFRSIVQETPATRAAHIWITEAASPILS